MERRWLLQLRCDDNDRPEPLSDPVALAAAEVELGPAATAWAVQAAERAARATLDGSYRGGAPASLLVPVRRVCEACVLTVLRGLLHDVPADEIAVPAEAVRAARDAVHAGLPLERLLRAMWNTFVRTMDALLADMRDAAGGGMTWAFDARRYEQLSFGYLDAFSDGVVAEYNSARDT